MRSAAHAACGFTGPAARQRLGAPALPARCWVSSAGASGQEGTPVRSWVLRDAARHSIPHGIHKTKLGGRVRHDACGGGQNIGRCGYSNGGLGFLCGFSTALQRVLCTVANRSLTLRAILSLPPHSEFAVHLSVWQYVLRSRGTATRAHASHPKPSVCNCYTRKSSPVELGF